jgi:hypothetical protein
MGYLEEEGDHQQPERTDLYILPSACRHRWAAAEPRLCSGADQSALIRWLETLAPSAPKTDA